MDTCHGDWCRTACVVRHWNFNFLPEICHDAAAVCVQLAIVFACVGGRICGLNNAKRKPKAAIRYLKRITLGARERKCIYLSITTIEVNGKCSLCKRKTSMFVCLLTASVTSNCGALCTPAFKSRKMQQLSKSFTYQLTIRFLVRFFCPCPSEK